MQTDSNELHAGLGDNLIDVQNSFMFSCPYLGTLEDTDTLLSYPSQANHCFRTKTPAAVDLSHQEAYCLTDMHPGCHVFQQTVTTSPGRKRKKGDKSDKRTQRVSIYALPLILILIFFAAILWWPAPGTTFEEAIAFGAQLRDDNNRSEVEEPLPSNTNSQTAVVAEDGQSQNNRQAAPALSSEAEDAPKQAGQRSGTEESAQINEQPALDEQELKTDRVSSSTTEEENQTESGQAAVQTSETDDENGPPQNEESEDFTEQTSPTSGGAATSGEEINSSNDIVNVDGASSEGSQSDEAPPESEIDQESSLSAIITGLPIIDTFSAEQITPTESGDPSAIFEGVVALIGPDTETPLALREGSQNERSLFVRETPSLIGKLLTIVNRRQQATVLGKDADGLWLKVRLETGVEGWVNANASRSGIDLQNLPVAGDGTPTAAQEEALSNATSLPVVRSAQVETGALNLRSGPGVVYEPLAILSRGEIVGLIGRRGSGVWVMVRLDNGLEGWVNASLLTPLN